MKGNIHFVGVGGVGMSALAQLAAWEGRPVSGCDRYFDRGELLPLRRSLEEEGIRIFPQDGSGVVGAEKLVSSAAVEAHIPDLKAAAARGLPVLSRGRFLREIMAGRRGLAVSGTNGKSTTTALLAWMLEKGGLDPTEIIGARLKGERRGRGNARRGSSGWFCFEADESDGSLELYRPYLGIITNISPDHFELPELKKIFSGFAGHCARYLVINNDCPNSREIGAAGVERRTFSLDSASDFQARDILLRGDGSSFLLGKVRFFLSLVGRENLLDALAAITAAGALGLPLSRISASLRDFPGLRRRMEVVGSGRVTVIDDYAHNPAKISASLTAARLRGKRVVAVYQPHGFAPLRRFLKETAAAFSTALRPGDSLLLLPVYYAGGSAPAGIEAGDLLKAIKSPARAALIGRDDLLFRLEELSRPGDVVVIMGARDPSLSGLSRRIAESLNGT